MTYAETLEFLYASLPVFQQQGAAAYKPGSENTAAMSSLLGDPPRRFTTIHVAGTNGKGSCSHILAAILQSAGYRTGLFTSPHLKDFRERIRVDGVMISEAEVVEFTEKWRDEMVGRGLTFFEMCTLLAFDHFAREGVDVAVIETGLGGRLDATNIITPALSVITNIGLDHTAQLGNTLEAVAREKAGIIKPFVPVVVGQRDGATDPVFEAAAAVAGAPLTWAQSMCSVESATTHDGGQRLQIKGLGTVSTPFTLTLDLPGSYQRHNIVTVLAACRVLATCQIAGQPANIPPGAIHAGCAAVCSLTGLKGRWQVLSREPLTICDTGHNAHGLREVAAQLESMAAAGEYEKLYIIIGVVADKDLGAILPLLPRDAQYIFTQPSTPRARPAADLAAAAKAYGLHGSTAPNVPEALATARSLAVPNDMIFIGGSTFTVADIPGL
ncbi:MAG: bifunctional folylpolyglutamate synthase/dihydrofolate synthase [Rikenellaceae bacterium]|jgi:dihydrofolate synthase/folylpolyglutamate synthase|nr:bifunctional folylpolyglutamate synthase/dihydrofolate synthase [Rikenellaceae bacterium]